MNRPFQFAIAFSMLTSSASAQVFSLLADNREIHAEASLNGMMAQDTRGPGAPFAPYGDGQVIELTNGGSLSRAFNSHSTTVGISVMGGNGSASGRTTLTTAGQADSFSSSLFSIDFELSSTTSVRLETFIGTQGLGGTTTTDLVTDTGASHFHLTVSDGASDSGVAFLKLLPGKYTFTMLSEATRSFTTPHPTDLTVATYVGELKIIPAPATLALLAGGILCARGRRR